MARHAGGADSLPTWEVPCKHLAEEFDRDPFAMLAWRGKGRDELLAALRQIQGGTRAPGDDAADPAGSSPGTALRAILDGSAPPLEQCLEAFWAPGLSPARLRALSAASGPATPDLLLRMFPPPPVQVRGKDLAEVLAPAYQRLAAEPGPAAEVIGGC
jgi:uncharacterized Zn finger protein